MYTDSAERIGFSSLPRSISCPELTMYQTKQPRLSRKRTCSENYGQQSGSTMNSTMTLNRVQSEGDLSRIDKMKTFKTFDGSTLFQTNDLLSNILTALGSVQQLNEDARSNSQLSTGERTDSRQSLAHSDDSCTNRPTRPRAFSEFNIPQQDTFKDSNELTWNGNNDHQLKEYLRNRPKKFSIASVFSFKSESTNRSETHRQNTLQVPGKGRNRSFISKINPFKSRVAGQEGKRHSVSSQDPQIYLNNTARGRESRFSLSQSASENIELLEKTTIADLMRAIEEVQSKSNISPGTPFLTDNRRSFRSKTSTVTANIHNLPVPRSTSRRGSLRPVPAYTAVFTSQPNNSSNTDRELPTSSTPRPVNSTHLSTPTSSKTTTPSRSPPSQILRRTFSLRPSPLATSSTSASNARALPGTPSITLQSPNVTKRNILLLPESRIDSVGELKKRVRHKRADSK